MSVRIHDYEEAIKFVKQAIDISHTDASDNKSDKKQNDSDASLYLLLGSIYQKHGDYDRASSCYNTTIEKDPHCVEAYNNLGVISKTRLNYQEAIDYFQQALKVNPNRSDIYYNLGNTYKLMGNLEYAKDNFEQTLKLKPDYVTAYNNLGNILDRLEQYQYALAVYHKGLKIDFNNWKIHYNIAITFEKIGNTVEAESHYRKAIEINPTFIEAYNNLGILYEKNGNYDAAKKCYNDLLSFNPDYNKGHNNLGRTYECLGMPDEALAEYKKALAGNPNYKIALNNSAKLCYDRHDYQNAEKLYERLLRMEKDNYTAAVRLANIKEETDPNAALSLYQTLIERNEKPEDLPALHKHIADTYSKLDRNEEALEHYRIVRKLQSDDTDNIMRMAKLSEKIGLLHEAVSILEEAKKNNENDPQIMKYLGEVYMESGDNEKAIETLKSLQSISPDKDNIYNLAKAEYAAGHSDQAMQYMNELLTTGENESLLDLNDLTEKLALYEQMLAELAQQSAEQDEVLDKLKDYTMEELLADPEPEDDQSQSDALSELEESLIAETDNGKLISFGDNAPVYDVEEEEEILDASDAEEEDKTAGGNSFLNLLKGQDTYGEMVYRKEEKEPEFIPPPPPPPKPPNPYEGLPPPTITVTAENAMDDDRLVRLEDAILKLTEQIVNLMKGNPELYGGLPLADENEQLKQQIDDLTKKLEGKDNPDEPEFASFDDLDQKDKDDYEFASYEDLDSADDTASRLLQENESDDDDNAQVTIHDEELSSDGDEILNQVQDDNEENGAEPSEQDSSSDENAVESDDDDTDEDVIDTPVEVSDDGEELIFTEEEDDDDIDNAQCTMHNEELSSDGNEILNQVQDDNVSISAPEEELVFAEEDDIDEYDDDVNEQYAISDEKDDESDNAQCTIHNEEVSTNGDEIMNQVQDDNEENIGDQSVLASPMNSTSVDNRNIGDKSILASPMNSASVDNRNIGDQSILASPMNSTSVPSPSDGDEIMNQVQDDSDRSVSGAEPSVPHRN
ncbi:MAG: tetratricopeptide repeat protein, partial [Spirochaetales bacterium]|nr:tetratricopeptide repeat protein [Spirochaetales bacterium]